MSLSRPPPPPSSSPRPHSPFHRNPAPSPSTPPPAARPASPIQAASTPGPSHAGRRSGIQSIAKFQRRRPAQSSWEFRPSSRTEGSDEGSVLINGGTGEPGDLSGMRFVHRVSVDVPAPLDAVWKLWTDLEKAPCWMRWIDRVEVLPHDVVQSSQGQPIMKSLSRWICNTSGFEVAWVAQIEKMEVTPMRCFLQWATIEGLHSNGEVAFTSTGNEETRIELVIDHSLPSALGRLMSSYNIQDLVHATLKSDLEQFQQYAIATITGLDFSLDRKVKIRPEESVNFGEELGLVLHNSQNKEIHENLLGDS